MKFVSLILNLYFHRSHPLYIIQNDTFRAYQVSSSDSIARRMPMKIKINGKKYKRIDKTGVSPKKTSILAYKKEVPRIYRYIIYVYNTYYKLVF